RASVPGRQPGETGRWRRGTVGPHAPNVETETIHRDREVDRKQAARRQGGHAGIGRRSKRRAVGNSHMRGAIRRAATALEAAARVASTPSARVVSVARLVATVAVAVALVASAASARVVSAARPLVRVAIAEVSETMPSSTCASAIVAARQTGAIAADTTVVLF